MRKRKGPKPEETCDICRRSDGEWTNVSLTHGTNIGKAGWWCYECNGWVTTVAEAKKYELEEEEW